MLTATFGPAFPLKSVLAALARCHSATSIESGKFDSNRGQALHAHLKRNLGQTDSYKVRRDSNYTLGKP